ncbi:MAG: hypothetical protein IPN71_14690 [Fibrobacteres bacterium]|nr:hypothetical protein [Fibrobacterota bacterium]
MRLPILLFLAGIVVWCAFTSCAPRMAADRWPGQPLQAVASPRLEGLGTGKATDPSLARDLADSRACRNLATALEARVRVAMTHLDSLRGMPNGPTQRGLGEGVGNLLRNTNLVGCRIERRLGSHSKPPFSLQSVAVMDSAEAVEAARAAVESARAYFPDTAFADTLLSRMPSLLGKL